MRSLLIIQISSYIAPLMLLPYLSRTLGLENFGVAYFGISFVSLSVVIIDYGFELYAPYIISKRRKDTYFIREISGIIFAAKLFLFLIVSLIVLSYSIFGNSYQTNFVLLFLFPIFLLTLQPNWLFQSLENVSEISGYFILSRVFYVIFILLLVHNPDDYYFVIISLGLSYSINTYLSLRKMIKLGYKPIMPDIASVFDSIKASSGYFASRASSSIYGAGGTVFLGLVSNNIQVGSFASAEQLFRAMQGLFVPINQALYPYMSRKKDDSIFILIFTSTIIVSILVLLLGSFFARDIIQIVFGYGYEQTYWPLIGFFVVLIINVPGTLIGYPYLGAKGYSAFVNKTVIIAAVLQLALLVILYIIEEKSAFNVVITIIIAELVVAIMRGYKLLVVKLNHKC